MNNEEIEIRKKVIEHAFGDEREIRFMKNDNYDGDLFITPTGEVIYLEFQIEDFTTAELAKYTLIAEDIYEKFQKDVSVYIICPDYIDVCVKECEIKSEAEFTIKLACIKENPSHFILDLIKNKLNNDEKLTEDDLHALSMLPVMCEKQERLYFRQECFKIMNQL